MLESGLLRKVTLPVFWVILFNSAFCQENYIPGYIIQLEGDTLPGFVDYRNWKANPSQISFKEKLSDKKSDYSFANIKGFGVPGDCYESAKIKREAKPNNLKELDYNQDLLTIIDTTFLQILLQGPKSLYYYRNTQGSSQFYIKKEQVCELLIFKNYLITKEEKDEVIENRRYIAQLSSYLQDCPSVYSKLSTTQYLQNSLEDLFQFYYKCSGSVIKYQKKTEKASAEFGLLAGITLTSLKFKSDDNRLLVKADYKPSGNFAAGLYLNIILPRNLNKFSVYNEIIYSSFNTSGSYSYSSITKGSVTVGYSYVKMNNMLRLKVPFKKIFVYLNAGISNGYLFNEKDELRNEITYNSVTTVTYSGDALDETKKHELGILLGSGLAYKKYSLDVKYERGNGLSKYVAISSITNSFYFMLGYRF